MIDKKVMKHILKCDDVVGSASVSTHPETGETMAEAGDRKMFIELINDDPQNELRHLITMIRTIEKPGCEEKRYKEISTTTKGLFLLFVLLSQYLFANEIIDAAAIEGDQCE